MRQRTSQSDHYVYVQPGDLIHRVHSFLGLKAEEQLGDVCVRPCLHCVCVCVGGGGGGVNHFR